MQEEKSLKVRMPHLIPVFMPMIVSGAVLNPIIAEHNKGGVQTFVYIIGILSSITGMLFAFLVGFKARELLVEDSSLVIGKHRIAANDMLSMRVRKTMVQVFATKLRARSSFVFRDKDLAIGLAVLSNFAAQNGVKFEQS